MIEEHEVKILTSHGIMTEKQLKAYNERKAAEASTSRVIIGENSVNQVKRCPYINGIHKSCLKEKCAFYDAENMQCYNQGKEAKIKTLGKVCPLSFGRAREACSKYCAMYKDECCTLLSD